MYVKRHVTECRELSYEWEHERLRDVYLVLLSLNDYFIHECANSVRSTRHHHAILGGYEQ